MGSSPLTRGKLRPGIRSRPVHGLIPAHAGKTSIGCVPLTIPWAHPRSRGENPGHTVVRAGLVGSSPLTRGKLTGVSMCVFRAGLIPAHAGKTGPPARPRGQRGAHPRSRGENHPRARAPCRSWGSSPLTRGKPRRILRHVGRTGLIPAHAGKTSRRRRETTLSTAHPRSRGENPTRPAFSASTTGSSPLTRGKPVTPGGESVKEGLIPAHAGKTPAAQRGRGPSGAHPRSRGENADVAAEAEQRLGSSPLTRGKPGHRPAREDSEGLIPAHAGKTQLPARSDLGGQAHPRSRGENSGVCEPPQLPRGSSPLTRGKLHLRRGPYQRARLIPAHAGKTPAFSWASRGAWAHPRSRGENDRPAAPRPRPRAHPRSRGENPRTTLTSTRRPSSSPLTRGKRHRGFDCDLGVELIPAHAGKTTVTRTVRNTSRAHPRSRGENITDFMGWLADMSSSPLTRGKPPD